MGSVTVSTAGETITTSYGSVRKSGPGYVRYEDLTGATFLARLKSLTSPAVVTLPEGVFELPGFSQGGSLYGVIFQGNLRGLSGSGLGTIVQVAPNSITQPSIDYVSKLTSSSVNLLMAIITGGGFDSPELSQLHLRGTEQKGVLHSPMQWQKSTNGVFHDVLISGFPGAAPTPPTEVGGVQISGATFVGNTIKGLTVDGRRYDPTTNVPGASVSSSLLMLNRVNELTTPAPRPASAPLTFVDPVLTGGLYGPIAMWHSTNVVLQNLTGEGTINHEQSGWIDYVGGKQIGKPVTYNYQTADDRGDTTFTDFAWAPSTQSAANGMPTTHLIDSTQAGTPSAPIIRAAGKPVPQWQQGADNKFTVVTK